jgi:hypothetical protein
MRMILAAAVAASALVSPTLASAGSFESTGYIESVNSSANTLRIRGGDAYKLPADVDVSQFRAGQRVYVSWNTQNPKLVDFDSGRNIAGVEATGIRAAH